MRTRFFSAIGAATVVAVVSLAPPPTVGQVTPAPPPESIGGCPGDVLLFHNCAQEKAKTFNPPRTPRGTPDLQGYWRAVLTSDFSVEGVTDAEPRTRDAIMPWTVAPPMVVDPPDRRIPYQPWAAKLGRKGVHYEQYVDPRTACGTGGVGRAVPGAYQFIQSESDGHVLWLYDDQNVSRFIPTDGRPHIGKDIKLLQGDSVGRWEGTSLVVDVTNLKGFTWLDDAGNFYTDAAHIVERLTMIDPDTIHYQLTLEDPTAYTRPWTMSWAFGREKQASYELLEVACWEGERDVPLLLKLGFRRYFGQSWRER